MELRFTDEHVETWRSDGAVLIERFFTEEEVSAVRSDFVSVFGKEQGGAAPKHSPEARDNRSPDRDQFAAFDSIPLECSPALNLIAVHPALVALARAALLEPDVRLYQSHVWAKFTGEADYDQPFHCDFVNHTLTVPSEDPRLNSVTFFCYFSDVTEEHGPMHYVAKSDSRLVGGPEATFSTDPETRSRLQIELSRFARSTAAPAGSVFAYGIDVYHRGTNLTAPHGNRFVVTSCFKAARNEFINYFAWPFHHRKPWNRIFDHATPEQLACFGVPPPGHAFWTEQTLAQTKARYPGWNAEPYWRSRAEEATGYLGSSKTT